MPAADLTATVTIASPMSGFSETLMVSGAEADALAAFLAADGLQIWVRRGSAAPPFDELRAKLTSGLQDDAFAPPPLVNEAAFARMCMTMEYTNGDALREARLVIAAYEAAKERGDGKH